MTNPEPDIALPFAQTSPAARRRGRRPGYDIDTVLETALRIFWRKGFSATSLDDLVTATGLSRPSLYLAFGSKERLYLQAIALFRDRQARQVAEILDLRDGTVGVAERIDQYLCLMIGTYAGNDAHRGDAITCSSLAETSENDAIRQFLKASIEASDRALQAFFQKAKTLKLIDDRADPGVLGYVLSGLILNLQQRARAGASVEELSDLSSRAALFLLDGQGTSRNEARRCSAA